jgi:hypothetical protein
MTALPVIFRQFDCSAERLFFAWESCGHIINRDTSDSTVAAGRFLLAMALERSVGVGMLVPEFALHIAVNKPICRPRGSRGSDQWPLQNRKTQLHNTPTAR